MALYITSAVRSDVVKCLHLLGTCLKQLFLCYSIIIKDVSLYINHLHITVFPISYSHYIVVARSQAETQLFAYFPHL